MSIAYLPGETDHVRPMWLPNGIDIRVLMTFRDDVDTHATFLGVRTDFADFAEIKTDVPTFDDLRKHITGGWTDPYDVTCDLSGLSIERGRSVLWDSIDTGTVDIGLVDNKGIYDPRAYDTPFGPGRRIRAGAKVEVQLHFPGNDPDDWTPLIVAFVDEWQYEVPREANVPAEVKCRAHDGFGMLSTAIGPLAALIGAGETMGPRLNRILTHADWAPEWGGRVVETGSVPLQGTTFGGGTPDPDKPVGSPEQRGADALSEIKVTVRTEDGICYMHRDGKFVALDGTYRERAEFPLRILGRNAERKVTTWADVLSTFSTWSAVDFAVDTWAALGAGTYPVAGWHPNGGADAQGVVAVCASGLVVNDTDDDVRNDIQITRANAPTDGTEPTTRVFDTLSIARYGRQTYEDGSLIHANPAYSATIAAKLLARFKDGAPGIESAELDMTNNGRNAETVATLDFGDTVQVADYIPANYSLELTDFSFEGIRHELGPDAWTVTLRLSQLRTGAAAWWDQSQWDLARWGP